MMAFKFDVYPKKKKKLLLILISASLKYIEKQNGQKKKENELYSNWFDEL